MKKTFKQFKIEKGISDKFFEEMSETQKADLVAEFQTENFDLLIKEIALKAPADALKSLEDKIAEFKNEAPKEGFDAEEFKALKEEHVGLMEQIKALSEKGNPAGQEKGVFIQFIEKDSRKATAEKASYGDKLVMKAPQLMSVGVVGAGLASITPASGFSTVLGNYIDPVIDAPKKNPNIMYPLITVVYQSGTDKIWWTERYNEEGDAEFIGEGDLKPLISAQWRTQSADIKEVAVRWKMTKRFINHAPTLVSNFREHATQLVEETIDGALLDGDGTGDNISGVEEYASAFIVPSGLANFYPTPTIFDVMMALITQVSINNYMADTIILNTVWEAKMVGNKNSLGDYIIHPMLSEDGREFAGRRIIYTNKIAADEIIVGDLKKYRLVISEEAEYAEGVENDDFSKNIVSFRIDAYIGGYVKANETGAIVFDSINTILSAIGQP